MTPPGSGFDERVVVIEHEAFRNLWSTELDGGLVVEREDVDKIEPGAVTIFPDEGKRRFDIVDPAAHPRAARAPTAPLDQLRPGRRPDPKTPLAVPDVQPDEYIKYRGVHLIDKGVIEEYEFHVPYAEDPSGVITYYTTQRRQGRRRRAALRRVRDARADGPRLPARARLRAAGRARRQGHPAPPRRERRPGARRRRVPRGDPRALDHRARADDRGERAAGLGHPAVPVVARDRRRPSAPSST